MHEMAIASNMISVIKANAEENGLQTVKKVKVVIGELSGVVPESLEFCWKVSTEGTFMENSEFLIEKLSAVALCGKCEREYAFKEDPRCPKCGGGLKEILAGKELYVDYIEGD